jgi:hypothetical protein
MRVNIESGPDDPGACGVSVYIAAADPGKASVEVRCLQAAGKTATTEGVFEREVPTMVEMSGRFTGAQLDFRAGPGTVNSGCFEAVAPSKRTVGGCFNVTGLKAPEQGRLRPVQ